MARSVCPTCLEVFSSTYSFDKHRTGTYEPMARRCLTIPEMLARGMSRNARGIWITEVNTRVQVIHSRVQDVDKTA